MESTYFHEYSWFRELADIDKVQLQKFEFFILSVCSYRVPYVLSVQRNKKCFSKQFLRFSFF
jgi:hypothetical protein